MMINDLKPLLAWYCLEKHIQNLVAIDATYQTNNSENIQYAFSLIGKLYDEVFQDILPEEYVKSEEHDGD